MRRIVFFAGLLFFNFSAVADSFSCDVLKARVDAKLQSKGVATYTLEIVPADIVKKPTPSTSNGKAVPVYKGKEVGSCEAGKKRLLYTRGD